MTDSRIAEVLEFWFADTREDPALAGQRMAFWFQSSDERDAEIKDRFGALVSEARSAALPEWHKSPDAQLALIIVLDQFPRNMYRGRPEAFESDEDALAVCMQGIAVGDDRRLGPVERIFYYMPLQHAESLEAQENAVRQFDALAETVAPELRDIFARCADYARQHHDIVAEFGRFPHRNSILGRDPTPAEKAYLEGGGKTFGQG